MRNFELRIFLVVGLSFYDLSMVYGHPPKIVWLRCLNQTTKNIEVILGKFHLEIEIFLLTTIWPVLKLFKKVPMVFEVPYLAA